MQVLQILDSFYSISGTNLYKIQRLLTSQICLHSKFSLLYSQIRLLSKWENKMSADGTTGTIQKTLRKNEN